jgi:hypothetical protein
VVRLVDVVRLVSVETVLFDGVKLLLRELLSVRKGGKNWAESCI